MRRIAWAGFLMLAALLLGACGDDSIEDLLNQLGPPYIIGNNAAPSGTQGEGFGYLFAQGPYTASKPTHLIRLHVSVAGLGAATQLRLGLYRDNGSSAPGNLVFSSTPRGITAGLNTILTPPINIPAGNYWITAGYDGSLNVNVSSGSTGNHYGAHTFPNPWPGTFPVVSPTTNPPSIIYMTVAD